MKIYNLIVVFVISLFFSCKTNTVAVLNSNNLPSTFFLVDVSKPFKVKTSKGALIKITENCFKVPAGSKVNIEIKEAYSMQDILAAGLSTKSNGRLLQSGGMIYFNATFNGENIAFNKPVSITTPSASFNDSMQLFKGEMLADSTINWVAPKSLDTSLAVKNIVDGNALFKANCANCHIPLLDYTGPALAYCRNRAPNPAWPYLFVNNVNVMLEKDPYAKLLLRRHGSKMTQFNLPLQDIKAIFDYCDNQAIANGITPASLVRNNNGLDTLVTNKYCGYDTIAMPLSDTSFFDSLIQVNLDTLKNYIQQVYTEEPMYSFSVDQSGWYNIDCFIDAYKDKLTKVELTVACANTSKMETEVYLCIPERKLLTNAYLNDKGEFVFDDENKVPLILKDNAFIIAIASTENELLYAIKPFTIGMVNNLKLTLQPSSKQQLLQALKLNQLDGVKIDVFNNKIDAIITVDSLINPTDTTTTKIEKQIIKKLCNQSMPGAVLKP